MLGLVTSDRAMVSRRFSPPRERERLLPGHVLDAKLRQQLLAPRLALLLLSLQRLEDRHEILLDGQLAEDRFLLRQITHAHPRPPVHRVIGDVVPFEDHLAAIRPHQAHDHVKAGRLPGAVRPEQPDDFPALEPDIDPVHHRAAAVNLDELFSLENSPGGVAGDGLGVVDFQGLVSLGEGVEDSAGGSESVPVFFGCSCSWMTLRLGPWVFMVWPSLFMVMTVPCGGGNLGIDPLGYPWPAGQDDITCVRIVIGFFRDANIVLRLFARRQPACPVR